MEVIRRWGDDDQLGQCYEALGSVWFHNNDFERAITYYDQALIAFKKTRDINLLVLTWTQAAYACNRLGDYERERSYLQTGVTHARIPPIFKGLFLERIAQSQAKSHLTASAIATYEQALSIYEDLRFKRFWDQRIQSLAQLYSELGDEEAAQRTLGRA